MKQPSKYRPQAHHVAKEGNLSWLKSCFVEWSVNRTQEYQNRSNENQRAAQKQINEVNIYFLKSQILRQRDRKEKKKMMRKVVK